MSISDRTPVNELDLPTITINALILGKVTLVGQVYRRSDAELLRLPNLGRGGLNKIRGLLGPYRGRAGIKKRWYSAYTDHHVWK